MRKEKRFFLSSVSMVAISSADNEKSNTAKFSAILSLCVDLGITTIPRCIKIAKPLGQQTCHTYLQPPTTPDR